MIFDAIILAGGRSSRLGGVPKALLSFEGVTLLERALDAVPDARLRGLVGDPVVLAGALGGREALVTREDPPFAGPAAGIAAGFETLTAETTRRELAASDWVLVLACDMPHAAVAVRAILAAAARRVGSAHDPDTDTRGGPDSAGPDSAGPDSAGPDSAGADPDPDAFVGASPDGRRQPLAALYRSTALNRNIAAHRTAGDLENLSVRALLSGLDTVPVAVPGGSTDDVDTPDDARRFGIGLP